MRFAIGVEYDGTAYYGWQRQNELTSLQACIEDALARIAIHKVEVISAGRTDRGVHACPMIAHFDTIASRSLHSWKCGTNTHLPPDIRVVWIHPVSDAFHARFSATSRRYRYVIYNHADRPGLQRNYVSWHYRPLDLEKMQQAATYLVGTHDLQSFRGADCQAKHAIRTLHECTLTRHLRNMIVLDVRANGFLLHMVRNIAGVLFTVGSGEQPVAWVRDVLASKQRTKASITAPSSGLYFIDATYPDQFDLPKLPLGPWFL